MDSLRVVLVMIGVVIILALLGHGLWTIRKNNQVAKDKREQLERKRRRSPEDLFSQAEEVDDSELQDPLKPRPPRSKRAVHVEQANAADSTSREPAIDERIEPDLLADTDPSVDIEQMEIDLNDDTFAPRQQATDSGEFNDVEPGQQSLLDETIDDEDERRVLTADESDAEAADEVAAKVSATGETELTADDDVEQAAMDAEAEEASSKQEPQLEVITLFVTGDIQGAILLQMTTELGLKYGDMDIFHRHSESSGHGPVLFSVANMFNPGTFDITNMERFETQGIVLFMTLPLKSDGHQAFTMMYNAANKIADAMPRAAVLDGNRNPVTKQSVQHTYQRIREFERKQRLQKPSTQW